MYSASEPESSLISFVGSDSTLAQFIRQVYLYGYTRYRVRFMTFADCRLQTADCRLLTA